MSGIFENKTLVISGGMGDIGQAICRAFASRGASVALCDLLPATEVEPRLERWSEEFGVSFHYLQVDVSDATAVKVWIDAVAEEFASPCLIVPNAATATLANLMTINTEQWLREININLSGAFYLAKEASQKMLDRNLPGRIVFIGSWAAHAVHQNMPIYSVAKAGLRMLCKSFALELASSNILVNEVAPGYVHAGLSGKIWEKQPELAQECLEHVPIKKIMRVEDVAEQVVYLCRPENEHMTGATLLMDGGLSLRC